MSRNFQEVRRLALRGSLLAATGLAMLGAQPALAQKAYPAKPVRLVGVAQALERVAVEFARSASAAEKLHGLGMDAESSCGSAFAQRVAGEAASYTQIARELNLKAD